MGHLSRASNTAPGTDITPLPVVKVKLCRQIHFSAVFLFILFLSSARFNSDFYFYRILLFNPLNDKSTTVKLEEAAHASHKLSTLTLKLAVWVVITAWRIYMEDICTG